jgi:peptide deformylase
MKKLVLYPNRILREVTPEITAVDEKLLKDINDLREVLLSKRGRAAGLAAPQIGLNRRFFGDISQGKKDLNLYINPKILATYGDKTRPIMTFDDGTKEPFMEGCLSFPDLFGIVKRYLKIEVSWDEVGKNLKLKTQTSKLEGIEAIVFQHELDHLDGILFVDHILEEKGDLFKFDGKRQMKWAVEKVIED